YPVIMRTSSPSPRASMMLSGFEMANSIWPDTTAGSRAAPPWPVSRETSKPCCSKIPSSMPSCSAALGTIGKIPIVIETVSTSSAVGSSPPATSSASVPALPFPEHPARVRLRAAIAPTRYVFVRIDPPDHAGRHVAVGGSLIELVRPVAVDDPGKQVEQRLPLVLL